MTAVLQEPKKVEIEPPSKVWRMARLGDVADLNPRRFTVPIGDEDLVSFVPMIPRKQRFGRKSKRDTRHSKMEM
jgi:hypothetical protein